MKTQQLFALALGFGLITFCRSTPGELKRETLNTTATSAEALASLHDTHQNRLNMLLNGKNVEALPLIEDFKQATLYFNKQPTQIRPVTMGAESGLLLCRFEQGICRVVSRQEDFQESADAPIRQTIVRTMDKGDYKIALEIGRALSKVNKDFLDASSVENIANKKNAAAFYLGLLESDTGFTNSFMNTAGAAYPELEFAQNIDGMDRGAVKTTSAKLGRVTAQGDIILITYVKLLKQATKDRLQAIADTERQEREEARERAKASREELRYQESKSDACFRSCRAASSDEYKRRFCYVACRLP
jgi:hypothetical protein